MVRLVGVYLLFALIGIVVSTSFDWPTWVVFIFVFIAFLYMFGEMLYLLYGTKNMKKVEKFLEGKRNEPIYAFVYAQANGTKEEQLASIEGILKKYTQQNVQYHYRFIREMLNKDYTAALEEADHIGKEPIMSYSKALVFATQGNKEQALTYHLPNKWMSEAILATIAKVENNEADFKTHKENAIQAARGIQRYVISHSFKDI
nr:hypothetical protein [Lysinibacillus timonensis]